MSTVYCTKLKKNGTAMSYTSVTGELGKKILNCISQEAWKQWLDYQTMIINEYRLNLLNKKDKEILMIEMEKFLFSNEDNQST